jgi:hypothetical protein
MALPIEFIAGAVEKEANRLSNGGNDAAAGALRELLLRENEETLVRFATIIMGATQPS